MHNYDSQITEQAISALNAGDSSGAIRILHDAFGTRLQKVVSVRLDPRLGKRLGDLPDFNSGS